MGKGASALLFTAFAVVQAVSADTLRLRSGQSVEGVFLSADTNQVKFLEPGGQPRTYSLATVEGITFTAMMAPASAAPATSPKPANVTVLAGTSILVRILNSIDTSKSRNRDLFSSTLESNLLANGNLVSRRLGTVHGQMN